MINSNGKKISENAAALDYESMIAEIKFLMKGFHNCQDYIRASAIADAIKAVLDNVRIFDIIGNEEREYIENSVIELEDYADNAENSDLFWKMVYLRRKISSAYSYNGMRYKAADSKFIGSLYFDRICTMKPTAYNYGARFFEYANTLKYIMEKPEVQDKWNVVKVEKLFVRAENFAESKSMLEDDDYLEGACYYYDAKRFYYRGLSDKLSEYQAIRTEIRYLWERYRLGKSGEILNDLINKYIDYTKFEWYSYHNEKRHFKTLIEWTKAWAAKENSVYADENYMRLFRYYKSFWN